MLRCGKHSIVTLPWNSLNIDLHEAVVTFQHEHSHGSDIFNHSAFRAVLLIVALTFHSLFEGLAIGLQKDLGELMSIFIAVVVHKAVMAFSLGKPVYTFYDIPKNFYQYGLEQMMSV